MAALQGLLALWPLLSSAQRWVVGKGYELVLGEDGPVEWLQFALLVLTACILLRVAIPSLRDSRGRATRGTEDRFAWIALVGAALFLLAAGEEVSWFQRVFDLATPESLADINLQRELNVHNIYGVRPWLDGAMLVVSGSLLVLALLVRQRIPVWTAPIFAVVPFYRATRVALTGIYAPMWIRNSEWAELSLDLGLCCLVWMLVGCRLERLSPTSLSEDSPERSATGRVIRHPRWNEHRGSAEVVRSQGHSLQIQRRIR